VAVNAETETLSSVSRDHGVTVTEVRMNRPSTANALSSRMVDQLHLALDQAEDAQTDLLVLTGTNGVFCGGVDLSDIEHETDATLLLRFCRIQLLLERLSRNTALTLARVNGPAAGAGADLVLACDVRLATLTASLRFPGSGFGAVLGTRSLAAETSPGFALLTALTHRKLDSTEMEGRGLWRVHPTIDALDIEIDQLAADLFRAGVGRVALRRLRGAARGNEDSTDGLGTLVRSLVSEPGLQERVVRYRTAWLESRATSKPAIGDQG
jgi:enoyl-CoA hydratase